MRIVSKATLLSFLNFRQIGSILVIFYGKNIADTAMPQTCEQPKETN